MTDMQTTNRSAQASGNKKELTDIAVIESIRAGDTHAFETVMRRYNQRLYRVARSILLESSIAEDAVQQAYINAFYNLEKYTHDSSFGAWLTRITINEALMLKRKPNNRLPQPENCTDNHPATDKKSNPATLHANQELAALIESAIEKLPDKLRHVFVLRSVQELNTQETAECLDINEAMVKTRLHRARNHMQCALNRHIAEAGLHVYEFAGQRCDHIVHSVLSHLSSQPPTDLSTHKTH